MNETNSALPHQQVTAIEKAPGGIVWIGTACGLTKYQGGNCIHYDSMNSILPSNGIAALFYSIQHAALFAGVQGKVVKIDSTGWTAVTGINGSNPSGFITALVTDQQGNLWAGTMGHALYKWDGSTWFNYNSSNSPVMSGIPSIATDSKGNLWVVNIIKLVRYDGVSWTSFYYGSSSMRQVFVDNDDTLWICSPVNGLVKFDGSVFSVPPVNANLTSNSLKWLVLDTNRIWVGTEASGVDLVQGMNVSNIPLLPELYNKAVNAFGFEGLANRTWFCGAPLHGGVSSLSANNWNHFTPANSPLNSSRLSSIAISHDSVVWVGSVDNGLYSKQGSNWTKFHSQNSTIAGDDVTSLAVLPNQDRIIGFKTGIMQSMTDSLFTILPGISFNNQINDILAENNSLIWIATDSSGLYRYTFPGLTSFTVANSGIPSDRITDLKKDSLGFLWLATDHGLARFDGLASWIAYDTMNSPLPENDILAVGIGSDSSVWAGTKNSGIAMLKNGIWTLFTICNSNLAGNKILSIETSPHGSIYIGTTTGVSKVTPDCLTQENARQNQSACTVFPNPASVFVKFHFVVSSGSTASLQVYNIQGQLVYMTSLSFENPGRYSYRWDIHHTGIPSGIYLYRLVSEKEVITGKLLLQRD
ncbi:MAG TPA: two-component regulator propeller domain-containing protein [Bacteroidales bacterium]|nr:two-component regulator propeller domain-containing protein [Bacteroidales bacterium]HSA44895.1 two-component regulator propeller domain-containing protein [Bacteroidales bacterium]